MNADSALTVLDRKQIIACLNTFSAAMEEERSLNMVKHTELQAVLADYYPKGLGEDRSTENVAQYTSILQQLRDATIILDWHTHPLICTKPLRDSSGAILRVAMQVGISGCVD